MSQSIAVVCEAPGDSELVAALVGRVIEAHLPDWYAGYRADQLLTFRGFEPDQPYFYWGRVNTLAGDRRGGFGRTLRRSEFAGRFPDDPVALEALRAIRLLQFNAPTKPDAIILVKDSDNKPERRAGLLALHDDHAGHTIPVVIGVAHTERECWLLAGFEPNTPREREAHELLCRELSLDPCRESHRLAAPRETDDRHPKRVLGVLSGGDPAREAACLRTAFPILEANGRDNGLADFLDALRQRLIHKLFGGPPPEARGG
ncbi:MAG: hypothetical protein K2X82_33365 [Gemmataceae bacterium]|nr:hypothetical protein [Gemmataceae bacterium]